MPETPRRRGREIMLATTVIFLWLSAIAQTNPSANEQKPAAESAPVTVLSDTMGVDFGPYVKQAVLPSVQQNWCKIIPESAKSKKAIVAIEFAIMKDGEVAGMKLVRRSGDVALDRAAWGGITDSIPFSPLPEEFKGPYLALRLSFYYNPNQGDIKGDGLRTGCGSNGALTITPSSPVKVAVGTSVQFSASLSGVRWALAGDQCAKSDCGTISASGLYAAPTKVSEPLNLTVSATQEAAPFKSASAQVTVLPQNPAK